MNKYKLEDYIPEEEFNQIDEPEDPQRIDDIPSVKLYVDDNDKLTIQISAFYHGPENKKIPLLIGNEVLQDLLLKAFQVESQKMFRRVIHGILGQPYGLPENKKTKTMTNETKLWQLRAGLITEGEYQESIEESDQELTIGGTEPGAASDGDKSDPNVDALLKYLQPRKANLKPIDTVPELKELIDNIVNMVQTLNKDALTDQEVIMAIRQILAAFQQKMGQKK